MYIYKLREISVMIQFYFLLANLVAAEVPVRLGSIGETTVYNYVAEIKAGLDESIPYFSSFKIRASLNVRIDTINSSEINSYLLWLSNVKQELYNGADDMETEIQEQSIHELSIIIQEPFMAFYEQNNLLIGLKFQNTEYEWSKNIKKAIAAGLQTNLTSLNLTDNFYQSAFSTFESTIHGICEISYDVHTKNYEPFSESNTILVTKIYEPRKCKEFVKKTFSHMENFGCYVEREEDLVTSIRKEFSFEKNGSVLILKKLIAQEIFYYFPWMYKSEIHNVQISQILQFETYLQEKVIFEKMDFQSIPMINNISYKIPSIDKMFNTTQIAYNTDQLKIMQKIKTMILKLADFIEENNLDSNQIDFKNNHILNDLLTYMVNLNLDSMEQIYNTMQNAKSIREEMIRKLFLEIIPHVGTTESCLFIRNIVTRRKYKVSDNVAIAMLIKLPSYAKYPTEKLLIQLEELLQMRNISDEFVIDSVPIKQAAILSFSSLMYETFKDTSKRNSSLLEIYLQYINSYLRDDAHTTYEMKLVYIMALRNIRIGEIQRFLVPIISGEIVIHERQVQMQIAAAFAVAQAINSDKNLVHSLFWPILSDPRNNLQLRIVAYDMLIGQMPDVNRVMNIHWFMANEQDKHLYHYHYTTIKSLAYLKDPCLRPVSELAKKIWRLTKDRDNEGYLSGSYVIDYIDSKYGFGESIKIALNVDDKSGLPKMGIFEYSYSIGRRSSPVWGVYWNTNIFNSAIHLIKHIMMNKKLIISDEVVKKFLMETKEYEFLNSEKGHFEISIIFHGRIVQVISVDSTNLNKETLLIMLQTFFQQYLEIKQNNFEINWQFLSYRHFYEMIVSTDFGVPVTFYNRLPVLLSTRIKIEYLLSKSLLQLKFKSDNRVLMHGSYEMVAYNPITNLSHSVERVSAIDIVYPQEVEIFYDFEKQNLIFRLLKLSPNKNKQIRINTNNLITIFNDESDILKQHCPLCIHYKPVDQGLKNSQSIFNCGNDKTIVTPEQWLKIFKSEDSEFGYDPIFKFFVSVSHKIFNEIINPNSENCGNIIFISEDNDISNVEINFNWSLESLRTKKNLNFGWHIEQLRLFCNINTTSALNKSSTQFWGLNITYYTETDIELNFIRKKSGHRNLVGCLQLDKSNSLTHSQSNKNFTFRLGISDLNDCNTSDTLINGTLSTKIVGGYKQLKHEIKRKCSKEYNSPFSNKYFESTKIFPKNCLFQAIENQSFTKYNINIIYKEVPEEILSVVRLLDYTFRALYSNNILSSKNYTQVGNVIVNLIKPSNNKEMNVIVKTPYNAYEIINLSMRHFNIKGYSDKYYTLSSKICNIFPENIQEKNDNSSTILSDWTLITGDYVYFSYSLLAKTVENDNIALKLYHGSSLLEINPVDSVVKVTFDHVLLKEYLNETFLPSDGKTYGDYLISLRIRGTRVELQLLHIPINIYYSRKNIRITIKDSFQNSTDGLCNSLKFR